MTFKKTKKLGKQVLIGVGMNGTKGTGRIVLAGEKKI